MLAPFLGEGKITNKCRYDIQRNIFICECNGFKYNLTETGNMIEVIE